VGSPGGLGHPCYVERGHSAVLLTPVNPTVSVPRTWSLQACSVKVLCHRSHPAPDRPASFATWPVLARVQPANRIVWSFQLGLSGVRHPAHRCGPLAAQLARLIRVDFLWTFSHDVHHSRCWRYRPAPRRNPGPEPEHRRRSTVGAVLNFAMTPIVGASRENARGAPAWNPAHATRPCTHSAAPGVMFVM